jgi:hypothetical protein
MSHQSYADDGLDCRAVASLCMAEVALGADTWPDHGGGGGSAVLAIVTLPTRHPGVAMRGPPAGSGRAAMGLPALARFAPRPLLLELSDQVSAHEAHGRVGLLGRRPRISVPDPRQRCRPKPCSTCDRVVLSSNHPQPHDQAQRGRSGGPEDSCRLMRLVPRLAACRQRSVRAPHSPSVRSSWPPAAVFASRPARWR